MNLREIAPRLWHWTAPHPEWTPKDAAGGGWDEVVSSYAMFAHDALVLFDPLVPSGEDRERFWEALDRDVARHGPPAILLTVYWHARSSQQILDRYEEAMLFAHEERTDKIGERARYTSTFRIGETLPGHVVPQDADRGGEVVFWLPWHRALVTGDVLLGDDERGVRLCPASWHRPRPRKEFVATLRPLLQCPIETLLPAHGEPMLDGAREALERALEV